MTPDARAARERKQKIFVVVGGLFLVAMLAIQLPKLLGGSSSPEAAPPAQPTLPGQVTSTPEVGIPATARTPAATMTKLTSFTVFARKDPFVQQVATPTGLGAAGGAGDSKSGKGDGPTKKFRPDAKAAVATIVVVNGARQVLEPGTKFPAADPLFVLVAEKPGAKSVVVGIVGGAYSGGDRTMTLKVGKPVTLVNTTTGARYRISLVSVGSGDKAAKSEQSQPKQ